MEKKLKNACAYIRVSTDAQTELSPDSQKKLIIEYCKKNNYIISENDFYEDLGISGRHIDKRDGFKQMIAMCKTKEHPYDAIIVWKFSRFARNQEESIVYKSMLRKIGVEVISISEPISEGLGGKLTEAILEIMDEYYSINLAQETKRGLKEAALRGKKLFTEAAYGYDKKELTKEEKQNNVTPLVINEKEAEVVRYIFDLFVNQGRYVTGIAFKLNEEGFRTKKNCKWTKDTLTYLLGNPLYIGKNRYNYRSCNGNRGKAKINPPEEWIIVDGTHEPIIDEETFQKAQNRLAEIRTKFKAPSRTPQKHWLSGIVKCKECGSSLFYCSAESTSYGKAYFRCHGYQKGTCHTSQFTRADILENFFFEGMKSQIENLEYEQKEVIIQTPTEDFEKELAKLDKKMERIKEAYISGIDTIEEYKHNKALLEEERTNIQTKMETLSTVTTRNDKAIVMKCLDILKGDADVQAKNDVIKAVVNRIVYSKKDETMDFYFY